MTDLFGNVNKMVPAPSLLDGLPDPEPAKRASTCFCPHCKRLVTPNRCRCPECQVELWESMAYVHGEPLRTTAETYASLLLR